MVHHVTCCVVLLSLCRHLQAMVLLSPPDARELGDMADVIGLVNSHDRDRDLDPMTSVDLGMKFLSDSLGDGRNNPSDAMQVEVHQDCGVGVSQDEGRQHDGQTSVLPAPQRVVSRKRRSSAPRPTRPSLRINTRRRTHRRRTRNKNRRRGRLGRKGGRVVKAQVELLVVVENSIYRKFLASNQNNPQAALARIRRYYGIVVAMMDQRYQTIDNRRLAISVRISGIYVAETRADSGWMETLADWSTVAQHNGRASVNTDKALFDFSQWIKAQHKGLPKFDHAMVFSGYRLSNKHGISFGGKAYLGAICDIKNGNSVSIVSDTGDFQCVKVATHELAHSLGAVHDGDEGWESCPAKANYVMAPVATHNADTLRNAFLFSRCSIKQMRKLLRSKKAACVRDEPKVYYQYDLQRMPPGQIISPDQHCQLIYGEKSTFCDEYNVQVVLCGQLWCRDPNMNGACRTNSYLTALPGTPCKTGMSCHLGECLANSLIQQLTSRRTQGHSSASSSSSSSRSSFSPSSKRRKKLKSDETSDIEGSLVRDREQDIDNAIPTVPRSVIRGRVGRPTNNGRVGRPSRPSSNDGHSGRRNSKSRSGRKRSRPRGKSRRKGRCKADQLDTNVAYCQGLVKVNPEACKRRAISNYCCRTCALSR